MTVEYAVGYAKPPAHSQFKPGRSGNPKGRPKGSKNLAKRLEEILGEKVEVRIDGKTRRMSKGELMLQAVVNKAIKGDPKALTTVMNIAKLSGQLNPHVDPPRSGVLVVPLAASEEEWERLADEHQRQFR